jgi:hypothetical protein
VVGVAWLVVRNRRRARPEGTQPESA